MDNTLLPRAFNFQSDGFRLLSIQIQNHYVLARNGNRLKIVFLNTDAETESHVGIKPYSTVIIGPNGVGKSFLLSAIGSIFRFIKKVQDVGNQKGERLDFRFEVEYFINGHFFKVSNLVDKKSEQNEENESINCWEDGEKVGLHRCVLPSVVLASSNSIADKFKTQKQDDGFYWYLGVRNENSPNSTGTKTLVRKTVSAIAECLTFDEYFKNQLLDLLEKLGFERKMEIGYSFRYKKVFLKDPTTKESFMNAFDNWEEEFKKAGSKRSSIPWGHKQFENIKKNPENITTIVDYLNKISSDNLIKGRGQITYNILDNTIKEDWKAINLLSDLDILSYPKIRVQKKAITKRDGQGFLFEESSSGETNMLFQFINILSKIVHHGLILIDEPEASSHPNWQIRYIDWLNGVFERFNTCHFIISTHSHFLLSDLEEGNSSIVALDRDASSGAIRDIAEGINTYRWSTDDILYEVFRIRNTNNEALERDLERAIQLIEEDGPVSEDEVRDLLKRFNNVYRGDRDPLGRFIKELEAYAQSKSK